MEVREDFVACVSTVNGAFVLLSVAVIRGVGQVGKCDFCAWEIVR